MSTESLMKFYESVRSDPDLEVLATNALKDGPGALVVLGLLKGFEFTEEELVVALSERQGWADGELSDTDLDLVAGGTASEVTRPSHKEGTPRIG